MAYPGDPMAPASPLRLCGIAERARRSESGESGRGCGSAQTASASDGALSRRPSPESAPGCTQRGISRHGPRAPPRALPQSPRDGPPAAARLRSKAAGRLNRFRGTRTSPRPLIPGWGESRHRSAGRCGHPDEVISPSDSRPTPPAHSECLGRVDTLSKTNTTRKEFIP